MNRCSVLGLLPADYWAHRRAAKRERLLSWRSLLDAAIERLDATPAAAGQAGAGHAEAGKGGPLGPVPPEFWSHHRAAHRENLLAVRSVVDACMGWLEERLAEPSPAEQATRIDIS